MRKGKETENPVVPQQFGKGPGRSLVNAELLGIYRQPPPVAGGHRALQACPLHGCPGLWKFSSEPPPDE